MSDETKDEFSFKKDETGRFAVIKVPVARYILVVY